MSAWGNICRICSSPAEHEIFAKIPTYLHANRNEFLKWQKPINKLIEETTGLKISPDDGLPKNICALCVSYLKHAVTFREQCINNALSFHFVLKYKELQRNKLDVESVDTNKAIQKAKERLLIEEDDLIYSNQRELDAVNFLANSTTLQHQQDKVSKALFDQYNSYDDLSSQLHYLQKIFHKKSNKAQQTNVRKRKTLQSNGRNNSNIINKNNKSRNHNNDALPQFVEEDNYNYNNDSITPISSDEMLEENAATSMPHLLNDRDIFAYKERNFIEDDIIDMEELQDSIFVNVPENSQERKCEACLNRFMFHDTYEDHKNSCIHLKLAQFVDEVNQLILLKSKEISTHEFIRRMIFSIRKICEWLISHYGDILLPDLPQYSKKVVTPTLTLPAVKKMPPSNWKNINAKMKTGDEDYNTGAVDTISENEMEQQQLEQQQNQQQSQQLIANVLSLEINGSRLVTADNPFRQNKKDGIINVNNNILIEIERSESRQRALQMTTPPLHFNKYNNGITDGSNNIDDVNSSVTNLLLIDDIMEKKNSDGQNILVSSTPTTISNLLKCDVNAVINPLPTIDNNLTRPNKRLELNVTARCQPCNLAFETLMAFEVHNALYHNCIKQEII